MSIVAPAPMTLGPALWQAVASAKAGDALAPVTLVAPSRYAAVATRRALARIGHGEGAGLANVSCTTVPALVSQIGLPELDRLGLRRAPPAVEAEVLRATAEGDGEPWTGLAAHPGTLAALARAHDELRAAGQSALDALCDRPDRAGEVARMLAAARRRLHALGLADDLDLRSAALAAVRAGRGPTNLGPVLLLELPRLPPAEGGLLTLLERRAGSVRVEPGEGATCTEVRPGADPEEEARLAARIVVSGVECGVPLWRQAVLHPPGRAYARLVHQELDAAGIATWGPPWRRLDRSAAGRGLLGLLELSDGDLPRRAVSSWVCSAPLSAGAPGRAPPAGRWDALSAEAGVVRGLDQWRTRLARLGALDYQRRVETAALSAFVEDLAASIESPVGPWRAWSDWAGGLLDHFLPADDRWPEGERTARHQVSLAVEALAELDVVSTDPDHERFRLAIHGELERRTAVGQGSGGVGDGVFVAPFEQARGLRFDTVVLVGVTEGVVPGSGGDDPLLPDEVRDGDPTGALQSPARRDEELLKALGAALGTGERRRIVTFARVDPRTGGAQGPSRFLSGLVDGRTVTRPVESFASSLRLDEPALHEAELTWRALDAVCRRSQEVAESPVSQADPALALGIEVVRSRAARAFTRFDGRLSPGAVSPFDESRPVSATRLEAYAECPRRFLFERELHVGARTAPEDLWRIEARARGSLVHAILERYVLARLEGAPRSLEMLLAIGEKCLDDAAAGGMVGRSLLWRLDRAAILRDLHTFHAEEGDAEPLAAEFAFGTGDEGASPAVVLTLGSGQEVRFLGRADRVDRVPGGGLVVSDYKTGRQPALSRLTTDPLVGGRRLQLPLYAMAAREHFGASSPVRARYWMVSGERSVACYHLELTGEVEAHFRDVVGRIARGVEAGAFPAVPGPPRGTGFEHCQLCDFDRLCPPTRERQWAAKRADPALGPVLDMLDAEVPASVSGAVVRGPADGGAGG